jgi:hypothetical protein
MAAVAASVVAVAASGVCRARLRRRRRRRILSLCCVQLCWNAGAWAALHSMISGSLIFSTEKSVGMKTFSHFISVWSRIGWACGSRRMGPRVASDGPAGGIGWARGSRRMGPRVASDGPAGGIGWARGSHRMGPRAAADRPAGRV